MNNFKKNFLDIVTDTTGKYNGNGPAMVLVEFLNELAGKKSEIFAELAEKFSDLPEYCNNGEVGGVNVDHQTGASYVNSTDSTWMTLDGLVTAAMHGGGEPNWWNSEWTTGQTDEEIAAEIAAEAADDACVRTRFQSFGTGNPIVSIQYSYDGSFIYEKYGRVTTKAEITAEQHAELRSLHPDETIRAAYIFSNASGGGSHAPI